MITLCRLITLRKISNTLDSDRRSIRNNLHYLFFILPWPISVYLYHTSSTPSFSISCIYSFSIFCTIRLDSQLRAILWSSWLVSQYKTWCINSSPLHFLFTESFSNVSVHVLLFNSSDNSGFWPTPLLTSSFTCSSLH